jgi:hypothetical protein
MNSTTHTQPTNTLNSSKNQNNMNSGERGYASQRSKPENESASKPEKDFASKDAATTDFAATDSPSTELVKPERNDFGFGGGASLQEKKDQLYRRVTARISELEGALATLKGKELESEHAKALRSEIDIAKDTMSGGWDKVGEVEAAQLSQWLNSSQYLQNGAGTGATPDLKLQANDNTNLPADAAAVPDRADTLPTKMPLKAPPSNK